MFILSDVINKINKIDFKVIFIFYLNYEFRKQYDIRYNFRTI